MVSHSHQMNPRLKFIGNFYSYQGLGLYYKAEAKEPNALDSTKVSAKFNTATYSEIEKNLMAIYKCKPEFPICIYDFTFKNRNPNQFVFKVKNNLKGYLNMDYIKVAEVPNEEEKEPTITKQTFVHVKKPINKGEDTELMVVRNIHLCQEHPQFEENFANRYRLSDPDLLTNKCFHFLIDEDYD